MITLLVDLALLPSVSFQNFLIFKRGGERLNTGFSVPCKGEQYRDTLWLGLSRDVCCGVTDLRGQSFSLLPLWPLSLATACLQPACPAACGCPGACMCVRQAALTIPQQTGLSAHKAGPRLIVLDVVWSARPLHLTLAWGRITSSQMVCMPKASSNVSAS